VTQTFSVPGTMKDTEGCINPLSIGLTQQHLLADFHPYPTLSNNPSEFDMKCLAHVNEKKLASLDNGGPWSREEPSFLFAVRPDSENIKEAYLFSPLNRRIPKNLSCFLR